MRRRLPLILALALAAGGARAAESTEHWSLACKPAEAGRDCDLTVPLGVRSRAVERPVVAAWMVVNRATGIDEWLVVRIDHQALPGYRLIAITEPERRIYATPKARGNDVPGTVVRDVLMSGKDMMVNMVDDLTGKQVAVKLPAAGFEAGRAALFEEVGKGANRK